MIGIGIVDNFHYLLHRRVVHGFETLEVRVYAIYHKVEVGDLCHLYKRVVDVFEVKGLLVAVFVARIAYVVVKYAHDLTG